MTYDDEENVPSLLRKMTLTLKCDDSIMTMKKEHCDKQLTLFHVD